MWIRTKGGRLINLDSISELRINIGGYSSERFYVEAAPIGSRGSFVIGEYKTEEKAQEAIDSIMNGISHGWSAWRMLDDKEGDKK